MTKVLQKRAKNATVTALLLPTFVFQKMKSWQKLFCGPNIGPGAGGREQVNELFY
jgi:hypothetical protein